MFYVAIFSWLRFPILNGYNIYDIMLNWECIVCTDEIWPLNQWPKKYIFTTSVNDMFSTLIQNRKCTWFQSPEKKVFSTFDSELKINLTSLLTGWTLINLFLQICTRHYCASFLTYKQQNIQHVPSKIQNGTSRMGRTKTTLPPLNNNYHFSREICGN